MSNENNFQPNGNSDDSNGNGNNNGNGNGNDNGQRANRQRFVRPRDTSFNPNFYRENRAYKPSLRDENGNYNPENRSYNREGNNYNSERPQRNYNNYNSDRPQRSYNNNREDRPQRSYNNYNREDRPQRSYDNNSERPQRNYNNYNNGDRPQRSYNNYNNYNREDRPQRSYDNNWERPQRNYNQEGGYQQRGNYNNQNSFGNRNYGNRQNSGNGNRYQNGDRRPNYNNQEGGFRKNYGEKFNRDENYNPNAKYSQRKQFEYKQQFIDYSKPMRLNKFLANSSTCSRREADEFIVAGVVKVNDKVVTELGTKIIPATDKVHFHDQLVGLEKKVYILLNKPKNCVTTSEDPQERLTVLDLVKNACSERIYPVGRLDRNTTGVMLLTNDGDLTSKLTHPKHDKKKIYQIGLDKDFAQEDMQKLLDGIMLEDGEMKADDVSYVKEDNLKTIGIEIHSGKNRVVRRMFEHLGYKIYRLDRVYFAGLTKKNLARGKWRYLS